MWAAAPAPRGGDGVLARLAHPGGGGGREVRVAPVGTPRATGWGRMFGGFGGAAVSGGGVGVSGEERGVAEGESLYDKLARLLETMSPWEKRPILRVGSIMVELVKLPGRKTKMAIEPERLAIHIRREDAFRGLFIRGPGELKDLQLALSARRLREVLEAIARMEEARKLQEYEL